MSEPTKEEIQELEQLDTPEARKQREKGRQARKKLSILADQIHRHAKATGTHIYVFGEGEKEGTLTEAAYCSHAMMKSMVMHIAIKYPGLIEEAQKSLSEFAGADKEPEKPKLIIEP
ncbi:MAG TPA: hypothetical protein PKJ19_05305 [Flavobacteriales bacterium]|nr:hypothetical protein [Flavobacteriales bacterium]